MSSGTENHVFTFLPTDEFKGKVALVTGAGQGIGFGIARLLGRLGAAIAINDVNETAASSAAQALAEEGVHSLPVPGDIGDEVQVAQIFGAVERLGVPQILINNAGILHVASAMGHETRNWRRVLDVNLTGAFLCIKAALPGMLTAGEGVIINISSIAAFDYTIPHIAYDASKAGLVALTRSMGYELAPFNVRVNAIAPGGITTKMTDQLDKTTQDSVNAAVRLPRMGRPEDIAYLTAFLASQYGSFIVGTTIPIAGGSDLGTPISVTTPVATRRQRSAKSATRKSE